MSAADSTLAPDMAQPAADTAGAPPRRRLFLKYALLFVALVSATLLVTSGFEFWFSYQESKATLVRIQQEKADAAAARIREFVDEIQRQIGWTTHAQWAAGPLDQRRQDYFRLLRQVPPITELTQLDKSGREQLKVSRLSMDAIGSEADFSQSPAFTQAKAQRVWFSPVYFRKQSEPYMTLSVANDGRNAGVTVAEINLKLIWDVITALKIGQGGYAYVVDGRGRLIAHPDISLVLRDTDLAHLPQIAAVLPARNAAASGGGEGGARGPAERLPATMAKGLVGGSVLIAHAAIDPLGWLVFVEVPLREAFAPLYGAAFRTGFLLLISLAAATLAALLLARRMTGPIRAIAEGAERLGAGELDRRLDIHTGDELEGLAQQFNRMAGDLQKSYAELEQRVRDRTAELSETLDQQTATAEVLGVINASPGDLSPVFDAILEKAHNLCGIAFGSLQLYDDGKFRAVAVRGVADSLADLLRQPIEPRPGSPPLRLLSGERFVQIPDMLESARQRPNDPRAHASAAHGLRTVLFVPLRREAEVIGYLSAFRTEVQPFTDKQITLLENFAAQAVIAFENARLITETREALEQQTATAEVLGVINSSPGDLAPVFDAMLERALRLCEAEMGVLWTYDGELMHPTAICGSPAQYAEFLRQGGPRPPTRPQEPLLRGERFVQVSDLSATEGYRQGDPLPRAIVDLGGVRTLLNVALRKENKVLGLFAIYRKEVRPFTDKQIALLQNFAAQAVIAMENARLITETQEALEQQTATAEVLGVINSSPGDLAPVFDAMLEKALVLSGTTFGGLWTYDGTQVNPAALRGVSPAMADFYSKPFRPTPVGWIASLMDGAPLVHVPDILLEPNYRDRPQVNALIELGNFRSTLMVPLRKDKAFLGMICIYGHEARPFTDKQIALLQNFAAQAVIAMENARLITETREALEQQTATAEVLGVINSSPGDLAPVFGAILEKANYLCETAFGVLWTFDGTHYFPGAIHGPQAFVDAIKDKPRPPAGGGTLTRHAAGEQVVHIEDMAAETGVYEASSARRVFVDLGGGRAALSVALRKDGALFGALQVYRQEVRPFSDKQIALLQSFAAQAVIAMENARLITETQEALEQQTATAEVLGVINSSPGDLAPVFEAILEKAHSLCEAAFGSLFTYDGEFFHGAASHGLPEAIRPERRDPFRPGLHNPLWQLVAGAPLAHVPDMRELVGLSEPSEPGHLQLRAAVEQGGIRTMLMVPLRKDGALLGVISAYRQEVKPFTDKQIALLQNFAAQAVIAMENARLITETREALEQQTATAEVLGVINSSPGDLAPVFDAMLDKAMRLCEAPAGYLLRREESKYALAAGRGLSSKFAEYFESMDQPGPNEANVRLLGDSSAKSYVHVIDLKDDDAYRAGAAFRRAVVDLGGLRTGLAVPLRKDGDVLGTFNLGRYEVRPFTEKQITLVQNFAAQAVIAMENARLIAETRDRTRDLQESLEYQTATSDVLKVISQSTFDLQPVLHTVVETALRICAADMGGINLLQPDGTLRPAAGKGFPEPYIEFLADHSPPSGRGSLAGRTLLEGKIVHIPDVAADAEFSWDEAARIGGFRTMLGVPLLREDKSVGVLVVMRSRVEPFSEKQLALFRTFADQAVIAIENARLLNELRERTDELAHSVEELKALSEVGQAVSSTLDLGAVLSTILSRSVGLTGSDAGAIFRYRRAARSFRLFEAVGWDEALVGEIRKLNIAEEVTALGEATARGTPVQIADLERRASNPLRDINVAAGYRSALIVPLVGADRSFGVIVLQRRSAGEYPETTVRLMQTLASQSVLAIQNARLFNEIAEKSEQLAEASRHKSQFLANMSHELRTPLNAILGYTELMVDGIYGELSPRAAGVLDRVQNNGKHLLALINDVLDLAKIEAGQLALTLEDYALPDVVHSVVSATEGLANTKGLSFTADIALGLPTGHGDARRLAQVLLNLVGNAVKFTDAGEVAIRAAAENGNFVLTVRDTGPGIAPEDHGKIFEEFQQVDSSNTRKKGGTGLGLAISKRMVEMQGGTITVDSELGRGATFRVSLPVRVEDVADELGGAGAGEMRGAA